MTVFKTCAFACLLLGLLTTGCSKGDTAGAQARVVTCQACHGGNGMPTAPNAPRLAGQSQLYLAKQLRDFRDGRRSDLVMEPLAAALNDKQINELAAYFESLDTCAD